MVSAMTSYASWRHGACLFLGNIRLKAISTSHQWPKYSWRVVFSSSAKQCLLSMNLKPFLMQTEQQTRERRIVNPRRGRFDTEKSSGARTPTWNSTAQATKMETASTNSGAEGTSLNEFRMLKYFKSKWKRLSIIECFHMTSRRPYWCPKTMKRRPCWCPKPLLWELNSFLIQTLSFVSINLHRCWPREWKHSISLNIWANIAATKHVLLADEFLPYRPRLLGFHSLHVNAMQCIYVGFSLSKRG